MGNVALTKPGLLELAAPNRGEALHFPVFAKGRIHDSVQP